MIHFDTAATQSNRVKSQEDLIRLEILEALNLGLHATYLFIVKSNLNEMESDITRKFDDITFLANTLSYLPNLYTETFWKVSLNKYTSEIINHFHTLDLAQENLLAKHEKRDSRSLLGCILEKHNNAIHSFNLPKDKVFTTLNEDRLPEVALSNLPLFLDCLLMYTHNSLDSVTPLENSGLIAYKQLCFDISEDELQLKFYKKKFDYICSNLRNAISCIECCITISNYLKQDKSSKTAIYEVRKFFTSALELFESAQKAQFASLLLT